MSGGGVMYRLMLILGNNTGALLHRSKESTDLPAIGLVYQRLFCARVQCYTSSHAHSAEARKLCTKC